MTRSLQNRRGVTGAPLKQRFVKLLRELLKRNGIHQKDLVQKLGVTASAASQIFSGALIPSQPRLDQLFELLKPEVEEAELIEEMAFWLRSGRRVMPSEANRKLFFLRCRSGLSNAELAGRTALPLARVNALENQPGAVPDPVELAALAEVLGNGVFELTDSGAAEFGGRVEAADSGRVALLPQIGVEELCDYDGRERIGDLAARRARGFADYLGGFPGAAAVFVAPAAALGLEGSGTFKAVLCEATPRGMEKLFLCADAAGKFFIRGGGCFSPADGGDEAEWSIPLVEITYAPGGVKK